MAGFWQRISERWAGWIGDRDLELALRKHLNGEGFYGDSARFKNLRLAAVQRPGWLQVFVFTVSVKARSEDSGDSCELFGIVRQDERYNRVEIHTFSLRHARNQLFRDWSRELVRVRNPDL